MRPRRLFCVVVRPLNFTVRCLQMRRICILAALLGTSLATAADTMFPMPRDALEPGHDVITPGTYEEDHFFLLEDYPGTSAATHYAKIFARWHPCEAPAAAWQSFGDASQSEPVFIHQLIRRWVNSRNDEVITLVLMYSSPGLSERSTPASNRQFVALTRLRHVDARRHVAEVGGRCAEGT
jgi:hypothetical protein